MRWQRGWRSDEAARASRSARWPLLPSRATIFRATSRPLFSSRASQTWPMPPEPRGRIGLYRPRKSSCARAGWGTLGFTVPRVHFLSGREGWSNSPVDPRDDELEFDFFDEPATRESQAPPARTRLPRRGGRGTGMRRPAGPPRGLTPILRLLIAIVALVALFVVFGLLIQSSAAATEPASYANYMDYVAEAARSSQGVGAGVADGRTGGWMAEWI